MEAMIKIAQEPWNLKVLDLVMYIDSPMSDSLCFSLPLLSYSHGKWKSVVEVVRPDMPSMLSLVYQAQLVCCS